MLTTRRSILDTLTNTTCPEVNTATADDSAFLSDWNAHRIGWVVAGVCAGLTTIIASYNIWRHAKNYRKPLEQRQVIRILMMPIVFAVISFFGYRYYREFISFALIRDTYEAITTAAFLCLMLSILSDCPIEQRELLAEKEKRKLVAPFCCWQFRPSKPYFIWMVKWSVLQFVIVKPLGAVAGVITEAFGVYCETSNSLAFANIYVVLADSISVVVALYGLIVALVFYQGLFLSALVSFGVIKATTYWTTTNIADGLNALATTIEMVFVALVELYAYPASEYIPQIEDDSAPTSFWKSFLHSQKLVYFSSDLLGHSLTPFLDSYSDFAMDIYESIKYFVDWLRGKDHTKAARVPRTKLADPADGHDYPPSKSLTPLSIAFTSGNTYDLVGAFSWAYDKGSSTSIDPQRPYITRANSIATFETSEAVLEDDARAPLIQPSSHGMTV